MRSWLPPGLLMCGDITRSSWRALGGPTEIELEGIVRIFKVD